MGDGQPSQFRLRLSQVGPKGLSLEKARLELDPKLSSMLQGMEIMVRERFKESRDLPSFLTELRTIAAMASKDVALKKETMHGVFGSRSARFYDILRHDLAHVGWDRIVWLAKDLSAFKIAILDVSGRRHSVQLTLPPSFPDDAPVVSCDLPRSFRPVWNPQTNRIGDVVEQFETEIESLQRLWDSLDDLDVNTWVIEPTAPSRSCTKRRIVLEHHITLVVNLDAYTYPDGFPDLQLLGSDKTVEPLLSNIRTRRNLWQSDRLVRENIEDVIGIKLISKNERMVDGGKENTAGPLPDLGVDCAICYNYRRLDGDVERANPTRAPDAIELDRPDETHKEGELPEICCENATCGKPFHRSCLREWLAADTTTRQSFGKMFGACPYCSAPISA